MTARDVGGTTDRNSLRTPGLVQRGCREAGGVPDAVSSKQKRKNKKSLTNWL